MRSYQDAASELRDAVLQYYLAARLRQEATNAVRPDEIEAFAARVAGELLSLRAQAESADDTTCDELRMLLGRMDEALPSVLDPRLAEARWLLDLGLALAAGDDRPANNRARLRLIQGSGTGGVSQAPLRVVPPTPSHAC
jgi:hypothetical protein